MADYFKTLSDFTGLTESGAASTGSTLNTGDLRRQYNFGKYISYLRVAQDPFFSLIGRFRKNPTDDPQPKFTEQRDSFHKRYAYVVAHSTDGSNWTTGDATVTANTIEVGDTWYVRVGTDYKSSGLIGNVYGNSSSAINVGASGTKPTFFIKGLLVKIPFGSDYETPNDYIIGRVEAVEDAASGEYKELTLYIVRTLLTNTNNELQWLDATHPMSSVYDKVLATSESGLESKRMYVVGSAFGKGTSYPETWNDQPYSTGYGMTEIWKTAFGMDNTTMATILKYSPNEFARIWGTKMLEHKWDIENSLWFSSQVSTDSIQYTQGIVDYVLNYGNIFGLTHSTKTLDDFLDDMSQYFDPRNPNTDSIVFFADTYTYNWLNKLSGFFANNIGLDSQFRADFAAVGNYKVMKNIAVNRIETIYGTMNIIRDIHLDGTGVSLVGVNMNAIQYRPLVGNGLNRDTTVYVGVEKIENTGVDRTLNLIQTEAAQVITNPELFAVWK